MKYKELQYGFSLFEVMMAVALFVTATAAIADIFIRTNKAQRTTQGIVSTSGDARFAVEAVARTARLAGIDYDHYTNGIIADEGETLLALRTGSNAPIRFSQQTGAVCTSGADGQCLAVCFKETCVDGSSADWTPLTPEDVQVPYINFFIYPTSSPYMYDSSSFRPDAQPRMTMIMVSEADISADEDKKILRIQTTVSSRVYDR